jgi:hypothetical protein
MIERGRVVVQDHVHARQAAGGGVLLLPVERHLGRARRVAHLEQQRARAAGRVVDVVALLVLALADAEDLGDDAAHLGGV